MSEKHTNKIVNLYFQETSYIEDDFNKRWEEKIETFELQSKLGHTIPVYYICPNNNYKNKTIVLFAFGTISHNILKNCFYLLISILMIQYNEINKIL